MVTERQIDSLRKNLDERETQLREEMRTQTKSRADASRDMIEVIGDDADRSVSDLIAHVDNALIGQEMAELRDIHEARKRMDAGLYSTCVDCGIEIEYKRLAAYPTAKRCAACQAVHEKTFAEQVHSSL